LAGWVALLEEVLKLLNTTKSSKAQTLLSLFFISEDFISSIVMDLDTFRQLAGFDAEQYIKNMKDELGIKRVRAFFDNQSSQAMSRHVGPDEVLEIHLPTLSTILSQRPELSAAEGIAKLKSAIAEELCHGQFRETDHNQSVVGCTISEMQKHLTSEELSFQYIKEKVSRLEQAAEVFKGTPIKKQD
jgi:hypothetical protein